MELAKRIYDEVMAKKRRAGENFKKGAGPGGIFARSSAEESGIELTADVVDLDKYGIVVRCLEIETSERGLKEKTPAQLAWAQADFLCRKLTYLLETLELVELDQTSATALLRSSKPFDGQYYEVKVCGGEKIFFMRYWVSDVEKREAIEFSFTIETFDRLAEDLAAALKMR